MSFFGMGAWEMMIILVAALVIFGPGKLPEVAGQAGRAVRDFRRMTSELSGEFEKTIADVTDTKGSLGNELKGMANQVNSVTKSVQKDLNKATGTGAGKTTAKSTAAKATTASPSKTTTTTASRTTTSTTSAAKSSSTAAKPAAAAPVVPKTASKADPLADLMSFDDDRPASAPVRAAAATPRTPTASPAARSVPPTSAGSADAAVDAVARARQRRLAAGYNSHRTP